MIQAAGSRAILDASGAETLAEGQFMALLDQPGILRGVSANPGDEELRSYLHQTPPRLLTRPDWVTDIPADFPGTAGGYIPDAVTPNNEAAQQAQIESLLSAGLSQREVQRHVFGYTGGAAYEAVRAVAQRVRSAG